MRQEILLFQHNLNILKRLMECQWFEYQAIQIANYLRYYQQHEQKEFANKLEKKVHNLGQKELSTTTNQIQKPFP